MCLTRSERTRCRDVSRRPISCLAMEVMVAAAARPRDDYARRPSKRRRSRIAREVSGFAKTRARPGSISRWRQFQLDDQAAALAGRGVHRSEMERYDAVRDRKTEPVAARAATGLRFCAIERLEDAAELVSGHARSAIHDDDPDLPKGTQKLDVDLRSFRRVVNCVAQHVLDRTAQQLAIGPNPSRIAAAPSQFDGNASAFRLQVAV